MIVEKNCKRCKLCRTRNKIVIGAGNLNARVLFIGEAPGKNEDEQGKPFVGEAGKWLSWMLGYLDLSPQDVYITNVVKCRPPLNRDPESDEIKACKGYLAIQIKRIKPKYIVLLGKVSSNLFGRRNRGEIYQWKRYKVVHFYHPAWLCYPGDLVSKLSKVRQHLNVLKEELNCLRGKNA